MYVLNIVFQAFFTLIMPAGLGFLASWLLVRFAGAPGWIYAPFLTVGILLGLYSMVKFVIVAMSGYERLERERNESRAAKVSSTRMRDSQSDGEGKQ